MVIKMAESYYDILGVSENANEEEIKKEYRILSKKFHPDQNPGNTYAEKRFKEISEAYAVLGEADKKKQYDKERKIVSSGHAKTGKKNYGFKTEDISKEFDMKNMNKSFEQFFGFHPETGNINEDKLNKNKSVNNHKSNVTDMFEKYMGFKK